MMTSRRLLPAVLLLLAAAACSKNETPTSPSCTVTAGAISTSTFAAGGGTASVPVTAGSGCTWTATSSATFVSITAGAAGTGNATVSFTVAANTGAARTATLTIAGTTFTISQSAAVAGTPGSLSAPSAASPVSGQVVTVTRPPLVVSNAAATGTVGSVTYRFEVSDQPTFPNDAARTFAVDGVAQGAATTTGTVDRDLGPDVLWYWHARATDGTATSAYSATDTFRTASTCAFTVSPATASVSNGGGNVSITVTTSGSGCTWTAVSNASFITVSGGASGTGNGVVTATVAPGAGTTRSGTLTVAGQTVTIDQGGGAGIATSFRMFDPAVATSPTTECRITSTSGTICNLESTSFPLGTNGLVSYAWTVQWTDGSAISRTQTSGSPTFSFSWTCGGPASTTDGTSQPLAVTLVVTDSNGDTATVTSGSGSQPPLFLRLFKC